MYRCAQCALHSPTYPQTPRTSNQASDRDCSPPTTQFYLCAVSLCASFGELSVCISADRTDIETAAPCRIRTLDVSVTNLCGCKLVRTGRTRSFLVFCYSAGWVFALRVLCRLLKKTILATVSTYLRRGSRLLWVQF